MRRWVVTSLAGLMASGCASMAAQPVRRPPPYSDFLVGRYAELSRDPVDAAERYAAALRGAPDDPMLFRSAAASALASGNVTEAAALGRRARAHGVDISSGRLAAAALALRAGRNANARAGLADLDGLPSEVLAARLLSVWAYAAEGNLDAALAGLGGEISARGSLWSALQFYQRAMVLDRAGRTELALAAYEQGDEAGGPRAAEIIAYHGYLLERTDRKVQALALYGDFLEGVDNPAIAAELARAESGAPPPPVFSAARGAAVGLFQLSILLAQDSTSLEQLAPLALAMTLDPALESPRIAFSDVMLALDQREAARRTLLAIPADSPYFEHAQSQIAFALHASGRDDEAVATLKAVVDGGGGRVAQRALADLYRSLDRNEQAAQLYAVLVGGLNQPKTRDWRLYFAQGATLERLGQWPAAESALQTALRISPDRPEVLNYLGYSWVDSGARVREGLALLERAAAQEPDEGYIIDSLGWAHFRLGNFGQAVEYLERAVQLSPGDSTLNDHLGDAYWRVGRRIEARYQWKRVLSLDPPPDERMRAQRKSVEGLPAFAP